MPLRNAQAKLAVLPGYADREELGRIQAEASASFNPDRLELMQAGEELAADLSGVAGAIERNEEEKAISLHDLSPCVAGRECRSDAELPRVARALVRTASRRRT